LTKTTLLEVVVVGVVVVVVVVEGVGDVAASTIRRRKVIVDPIKVSPAGKNSDDRKKTCSALTDQSQYHVGILPCHADVVVVVIVVQHFGFHRHRHNYHNNRNDIKNRQFSHALWKVR
jgi:hypothetical protein